MPMNLAQMVALYKDPLPRGVIQTWRRESIMMDRMTFEDAGAMKIQVVRGKTLPTVGFRMLNEGYTESVAETDLITEAVYPLGGDTDVDVAIARATNLLVNPRAFQQEQKMIAVAYAFNDWLINGDQLDAAYGVKGFNGIRYRLINELAAVQTILAGGIDVSPDSTTLTADQLKLIDFLDALQDACDGHTCDLLIMNRTLRLRLISSLRTQKLFAQDKDQFGRTIVRYGEGGPEVVDMGPKADQATEIIGNLESDDGSSKTSGDATSIYAVKLAPMKYLQGIQEYALRTADLGEIEAKPVYRTRVDWPVGIAVINPRSIARLVGVVAA